MKSLNKLRGLIDKSREEYEQGNVSYVVGFNDIVDEIEAELDECYAELPKDADGEYVHIGDRVENNERVERIVLTDDSWEPSVYIAKLPNVLHEYFCNEVSHYHPPTVEDILYEFAEEFDNWKEFSGDMTMAPHIDEIVARYAAKLRVVEDDE